MTTIYGPPIQPTLTNILHFHVNPGNLGLRGPLTPCLWASGNVFILAITVSSPQTNRHPGWTENSHHAVKRVIYGGEGRFVFIAVNADVCSVCGVHVHVQRLMNAPPPTLPSCR